MEKVSPEWIDQLMERVTFKAHVPHGTTTTVVQSFLDNRFSLATGTSACLNPEDFNAELGYRYAEQRCRTATIDRLWEMEGYRRYMNHTEATT